MFGLRKKSFAFGSPRYQRMKTPVSASALPEVEPCGATHRNSLSRAETLQVSFRDHQARAFQPRASRTRSLGVRNLFTLAPHAEAQLFCQQSVGPLYALRR